ncbi:MAG: HAMP domain-containing histidine kinase [Clostridia bacterium]|nr:HAMP domain-containing histidine kinase [Clostridia bacterium]
MKHISFKTKTTIWITLLITAVCALSVSGLLIMSRSVSANETRQLLSAAVERNADEIEYKNGILVIESDFDFYSDGVYTDVYNEKLDFIDGEIPVSLAGSADFISNELRTVESGSDKYYVYDKRIDFNRYEYEIDVISGQIIKYEADYSRPEALNASEYSSVHFENGISTLQAIDIALEHAGTSKEDTTVIAAELPGYSNRQVFRIEFTCEKPLYGSVWVRGIVPADATAGAFNAIAKTVAYIIPFFILIAAAGAYLISKKTVKRVEDIGVSAREISSGSDLSKRIEIKGSRDEIAQLADTFNGMLERLQSSFESEKQFTSDASHELRTPLAVIKAECEFALSDKADSDDKQEALLSVNEQADKMTQLVNALLSLTRTEQGTQRFRFEKADMSLLVEEVCASFVPSKGITVNTDIQKDIYYNMDISLISRMLENLLSNAVKYGKENGYINVSLKETDGGITLCVRDNGIGIAKEDIPKIWGRFYRADSSRSGSEGFGLGLALVDRIAALHGAKAEVSSVLGEGSEFKIIFKKV